MSREKKIQKFHITFRSAQQGRRRFPISRFPISRFFFPVFPIPRFLIFLEKKREIIA
jgi:hypothetical protein